MDIHSTLHSTLNTRESWPELFSPETELLNILTRDFSCTPSSGGEKVLSAQYLQYICWAGTVTVINITSSNEFSATSSAFNWQAKLVQHDGDAEYVDCCHQGKPVYIGMQVLRPN